MKRLRLLPALLLAAAPALAGFEGVLHTKFSFPKGGGTAKTYLSKDGSRHESEMRAGDNVLKTTTLFLKAKPRTVYLLDDAAKNYTEVDLSFAEKAAVKDEDAWSVKALGDETVAGYKCRHVLLTRRGGGESELWTTREIAGYEDFARLQSDNAAAGGGFLRALKSAGADGFPVKSVHRGDGKGGEVVMELVKVEKKSLPASLFKVPGDYKKAQTPWSGAAGAGDPASRKALEDGFKKMSPQQREMLEKLMKGRESK